MVGTSGQEAAHRLTGEEPFGWAARGYGEALPGSIPGALRPPLPTDLSACVRAGWQRGARAGADGASIQSGGTVDQGSSAGWLVPFMAPEACHDDRSSAPTARA